MVDHSSGADDRTHELISDLVARDTDIRDKIAVIDARIESRVRVSAKDADRRGALVDELTAVAGRAKELHELHEANLKDGAHHYAFESFVGGDSRSRNMDKRFQGVG